MQPAFLYWAEIAKERSSQSKLEQEFLDQAIGRFSGFAGLADKLECFLLLLCCAHDASAQLGSALYDPSFTPSL